MNENAFDCFIVLVEFDQEIYRLSCEKNTLIKEQQRLQQDFEHIQRHIEHDYQVVHALRKKVDSVELELKALDTQEQEKKKRINTASTTREYYSLEQELDDIKKHKNVYEESLFLLWQELDVAQAQHQNTLQEAPERTQQVQTALEKIQERINYLEKRIKYAQAERDVLCGKVDIELLTSYENMKEKISNPVVPIQNNSCSACFYTVSQHNMLDLKQGKLVSCKDCYRLLYASRPLER